MNSHKRPGRPLIFCFFSIQWIQHAAAVVQTGIIRERRSHPTGSRLSPELTSAHIQGFV